MVKPSRPTSERITILVVDSDDASRRAVARGLASEGDRVIEATSAELALYTCGAHAVDLVATAAHLPGMAADDLRAELRGHGGPPVVAYRIGTDPAQQARWLDSGGADCLAEGDPALIAARCRAVLRRSRTFRPRLGEPPAP